MELAAGSKLGAYQITGLIGEGGMGHVYRAVDSRIGRSVAIKVLPRSFAADPERLRRFEQEARAAGMLNHPNLLTLFEFGTHDSAPFMVAELLDGETLRKVLERGPLRVSKAVELATQIAEGLAAAHERGVVHRDLKPENIFITADERVKILDFGLAKLLPDSSAMQETASYGAESAPGLVVGTAGYMAPEQVRGQPVDHRADIFAFGAILYEMLSGQRAFRAKSPIETMHAILTEDPRPLSEIAPAVPGSLERIVRRCLQKNCAQRYQSARDLAFTLEATSSISSTDIVPRPLLIGRRAYRGFILGALACAALFAGGWFAATRFAPLRPSNPPVVRYLTFSGRDWSPAVSPDGRKVVFVSTRDEGSASRIWIKQLNDGSEASLTAGPDIFPRFAPDGESVLFTRVEGEQTSLWRISIVGGAPRRIIASALDGDFSPDGRRIAFIRRRGQSPHEASELWIAAADGSNPRRILAAGDRPLQAPRWSPDGNQLALVSVGDQIAARILLVSSDGKTQRVVQPAQARGVLSSAAWSGPRTLIYTMSDDSAAQTRGAGGSLYVHDVRNGRARKILSLPVTGTFVDIAGGRIVLDYNSSNQYLRESKVGARDADGRWLTRGRSSDRQPVYSADSSTIVFSSDRGGNLDLWSIHRATSALQRITDDPAEDWDPGFTPDGKQLLWSSNRGGHFEIWTAGADGSDARQLSRDGADAENPTATADGAWIVYTSFNPEKRGLWKMRRDGSAASRFVNGRCLNPEVSPDGQYVVYHTLEPFVSATIYVARVADGSRTAFEALVRAPFGASIGRARWMPDGKAIVFIGADDNGRLGLYTQAFDPARNRPETRRPLAGFDRRDPSESFGIAPDLSSMTVSVVDEVSGVMVVEGAN